MSWKYQRKQKDVASTKQITKSETFVSDVMKNPVYDLDLSIMSELKKQS